MSARGSGHQPGRGKRWRRHLQLRAYGLQPKPKPCTCRSLVRVLHHGGRVTFHEPGCPYAKAYGAPTTDSLPSMVGLGVGGVS